MDILKIKNEDGTWSSIPAIIGPAGETGPKGDTGAAGTNGKDGKDYTPAIKILTTAKTILENNVIYRGENLASIDFTLPEDLTINSMYDTEIDIVVSSVLTQITAPTIIDWSGDDIENNAWVPQTNKRYVIYIFWDGVRYRAISQGQVATI